MKTTGFLNGNPKIEKNELKENLPNKIETEEWYIKCHDGTEFVNEQCRDRLYRVDKRIL